MATQVLRPQDCLRRDNFYDSFSSPNFFPNRRRSHPVRTNKTANSPNPKFTRPNPKSNPRPSPPPTASSVQEGFRLLKRGEAFQPDQAGSEPGRPVPKTQTQPEKKHQSGLKRPEPETPPTKPGRGFSQSSPPKSSPLVSTTQSKKKPQSHRLRSQVGTPPAKPSQPGSQKAESFVATKPVPVRSQKKESFAGSVFEAYSPAPTALPFPGFLIKSSSVGPATDDASGTLRAILKIACK